MELLLTGVLLAPWEAAPLAPLRSPPWFLTLWTLHRCLAGRTVTSAAPHASPVGERLLPSHSLIQGHARPDAALPL